MACVMQVVTSSRPNSLLVAPSGRSSSVRAPTTCSATVRARSSICTRPDTTPRTLSSLKYRREPSATVSVVAERSESNSGFVSRWYVDSGAGARSSIVSWEMRLVHIADAWFGRSSMRADTIAMVEESATRSSVK